MVPILKCPWYWQCGSPWYFNPYLWLAPKPPGKKFCTFVGMSVCPSVCCPLDSPQTLLAGPQTPFAGPQTCLDRQMDGWMDGLTDGWADIRLPYSSGLTPIRAAALLPSETKEVREPMTSWCLWATGSNFYLIPNLVYLNPNLIHF